MKKKTCRWTTFSVLYLKHLIRIVFRNSAYGQQTVLGTIEHLKNPSLSKMEAYFNIYYVANNMALVLTGDFNSAEIKPLIEQKFGLWRTGSNTSNAKL